MGKRTPIHHSIKVALGYDTSTPDREMMNDWRERTSRVCKPCWELKYCPYGPFVEQSPLLPSTRDGAVEHNEYLKRVLKTGKIGEVRNLTSEERRRLAREVRDNDLLLHRAIHEIRVEMRFSEAAKSDDPISAMFGGPLPPIQEYRVRYEQPRSSKTDIRAFPPKVRKKILAAQKRERERLRSAIKSGMHDHTRPLDEIRRTYFLKEVKEFKATDYPESIPRIFEEASCNIFGHICPVFFSAESITETAEERRRGRYIPFKTKMRVVRRDNHTCQHCGAHLRDDEVEFDHRIPVSRGGSSEEHNIRLTCYKCNRDKSDVIEI